MPGPQASFTIHWPTSHIFASDGLRLGLESDEEAHNWRAKVQHAIDGLADAPSPPVSPEPEKGEEAPKFNEKGQTQVLASCYGP